MGELLLPSAPLERFRTAWPQAHSHCEDQLLRLPGCLEAALPDLEALARAMPEPGGVAWLEALVLRPSSSLDAVRRRASDLRRLLRRLPTLDEATCVMAFADRDGAREERLRAFRASHEEGWWVGRTLGHLDALERMGRPWRGCRGLPRRIRREELWRQDVGAVAIPWDPGAPGLLDDEHVDLLRTLARPLGRESIDDRLALLASLAEGGLREALCTYREVAHWLPPGWDPRAAGWLHGVLRSLRPGDPEAARRSLTDVLRAALRAQARPGWEERLRDYLEEEERPVAAGVLALGGGCPSQREEAYFRLWEVMDDVPALGAYLFLVRRSADDLLVRAEEVAALESQLVPDPELLVTMLDEEPGLGRLLARFAAPEVDPSAARAAARLVRESGAPVRVERALQELMDRCRALHWYDGPREAVEMARRLLELGLEGLEEGVQALRPVVEGGSFPALPDRIRTLALVPAQSMDDALGRLGDLDRVARRVPPAWIAALWAVLDAPGRRERMAAFEALSEVGLGPEGVMSRLALLEGTPDYPAAAWALAACRGDVASWWAGRTTPRA